MNIYEKFKRIGASLSPVLLPKNDIDLNKYSVIACDQYTSDPDYWKRVRDFVGNAPSTLNLILPEAELGKNENQELSIQSKMNEYLSEGLWDEYKNGLIYVERTTQSGTRHGIVIALDLEAYSYEKGNSALIRATEKTVLERLPARVNIRKNAALELPHILVLIDDANFQVINPIVSKKDFMTPVYDVDLMENGGHLSGWFIDNIDLLNNIADALYDLKLNSPDNLLFAMGDGNHSFAAAKSYWDSIKNTLSESEKENHPARYALVEIVNIYDPALVFEPIHRLLKNTDKETFYSETGIDADNPGDLQTIQNVIDEWLKTKPGVVQDYIHGADTCKQLAKQNNGIAIVFDSFDKSSVFRTVRENGTFVRKSFSIGEANEKRYYFEARKIR